MIELSKKDKKVARELIDKGLQIEFANGLAAAAKIIEKWKAEKDHSASYLSLYKHVTDFDKHIARRYDCMTGSKYLDIIIDQMNDGILTFGDLKDFSVEVQAFIIKIQNL